MFVGLPIININDHVLAAANSAIKYGIGLILEFLQKKQINGVNVRMTISLDVKIVSVAVKIYKIVNSMYWLFFAFLAATLAKNLNKPTSSRKMERIVIEKNKIMIFIGLIESLFVNCLNTSCIGANWNASNMMAPIKEMIQYVDKEIFPNFIFGKKRIDSVTRMNEMLEIIIVGIIKTQPLLSSFFIKSESIFYFSFFLIKKDLLFSNF